MHIRPLSTTGRELRGVATAVDFSWVIGGLGWHWRGIGGLEVPCCFSAQCGAERGPALKR